jgi:hypothetical protein
MGRVKNKIVLGISLALQLAALPCFAQTGGFARPSSAVKGSIKNTEADKVVSPVDANLVKDQRLDQIWKVIKPKLEEEFKKDYSGNMKIYNAQTNLASFLQDSVDRNKVDRIKNIAELYLILKKDLRYSEKMFIDPCFNKSWKECLFSHQRKDSSGKAEKVSFWPSSPWPSTESPDLKLKDHFRENLISSSQFVYPITVILHYSALRKLEEDPKYGQFFKNFRETYFPVVYRHHLLRWVLNRGFEKGFFVPVHTCEEQSYHHFDYVKGLIEKKFNCKTYANMMQDMDGWIAFSTGHLLAAHALRPELFPMDSSDTRKLYLHLENFIALFHSRMQFENNNKIPGLKNVELVTVDRGGMLGWKDFDYAGYTGKDYPGTLYQSKDSDQVIREAMPKPSPIPVAWDLGHSRRFVNFFWSMKTLKNFRNESLSVLLNAEKSSLYPSSAELTPIYSVIFGKCPLDSENKYRVCRNKAMESSYQRAATAYANNLLYRVAIRSEKYSDLDFAPNKIQFNNYLCGTNGWYRVGYSGKNSGDEPSSVNLELYLLNGGQPFFIEYNPDLQKPLKGLYLKSLLNQKLVINSINELLTIASFPAEVLPPPVETK